MDYVTSELGREARRSEILKIDIASTTSFDKYPAKQHARRVAEKLDVSHGLIYLPGAETTFFEDSDQSPSFRQRRYFYYLSGVDEPDCHLTYDIGQDELILYVPEITPRKVIWTGRGSTVNEALERYDVDNAFYTPDLFKDIDKWTTNHTKGKIYILHPDQAVRPGDDKKKYVNYTALQKAIDSARVIKDPHEIKMIQKANDLSAKAHIKVLREIRSLSNETEVEAIFLQECIAKGAKHQAYGVIAAAGENAAVLHYNKNNASFKGRQLMCLDAGAEWNCYASDVTRTFPLSGNWPSLEAENIYNLVLKMQETCISELKPGARFVDLHILAHKIAIDGLLELGILHNGSHEEILMAGTSAAFFPHGLGHHVGLEVHDVSSIPIASEPPSAERWGSITNPLERISREHYFHLVETEDALHDREWKNTALLQPNASGLEEGMVVTVEPGIYFSTYALDELYLNHPVHAKYINKEVVMRYLPVGGVRIEDDVLITKDGYKNLTTAPKSAAIIACIGRGEESSKSDDDGRAARRRADPLPAVQANQQSLWGKFGVEEKPLERMNRKMAQITIEETLKRLEKLRADEEKKNATTI